jgi:hypothetical protein
MSNAEVPFEQHLARLLPEALALQLHVLPAHQELIAPLPEGYVGPVMQAAEAWLKQHGYRTLGPWMIAWGPNGQPQLRRPVSGALKAVRDKSFQTVEIPEQLLVAVPFVGWPILPHNFTAPVTSVGLEVMGSPLLLALTNEPPTMAWIPVVPRGTRGLFGGNRGKMGLQPISPRAGEPLAQTRAWYNATLSVTRFVTAILFMCIFVFSLVMIVAILTGEMPLATVDVTIFSAIFFFLGGIVSFYAAIPLLVIWGIVGLVKMSSVSSWNRFWSQRPAPPELLLGSRGEGQVGAWLG